MLIQHMSGKVCARADWKPSSPIRSMADKARRRASLKDRPSASRPSSTFSPADACANDLNCCGEWQRQDMVQVNENPNCALACE